MIKNFFTRTRAVVFAVAVVCLMYVAADAQSGASANKQGDAAASVSSQMLPPSAGASAMYDDASKFLERKFAEFNRAGTPYSPALELQTRTQQSELAATYAARLNARGKLKGDDYYFLGLLYQLAGKHESVADPLRRYLAESSARKDADKLKLQNARHVLVELAAREGRMDEAEATFAEYDRNDPRNPLDTFRLHLALASAYEHDKNFARAATHARAAFDAAKATETTSRDYIQRAQLINSAGTMLANLLLQLKRDEEAFALMRELLNFGLTLPSAHVYENAVELLSNSGHAVAVEQSIADSAAHDATAPEIEVAHWLDEKPTTLAALRGRVVLLDFWATWCGACVFTMPRLKSLEEKFKERGLVVVGLTEFYGESGGKTLTHDAELSEIAAFKKRLRLSYPFAVADSDANNLRYGVRALPTTFLIDRRGVVRYVAVGAVDSADDALEGVVKRLLDEQP